MIEIHPNLYVGHQGDYEHQVKGQEGWAVVHACKEPYHRQLLGYAGRGAPKEHPEYFVAERGDRLYLNLVDAPDPAFIRREIIDNGLAFIHEKLAEGLKVLVHCNQGESRGPGIGFLYLLREADVLPQTSLDDALAKFRQIYPAFSPSGGISGFIAAHWEEYGLPRHPSAMRFSPRDFDQPLVLIPDLVEEWLRNKLPSVISRDQMRRVDVPALPFKMVREAVVNALIHRDYDIEGAKCQLIVDEHTVVVMSPGPPPPPITVEKLQSFNAPMLSRNPGLHYVFAKMELAEERGLGIKSLKTQAEQAGLPLPKYAFNDPYLVLTLYRNSTGPVRAIWEETLQSLSTAEKTGWEWLTTRDVVTSAEYAKAVSIPGRTALNHLKHLTELGLLRRTGGGPSTRYKVLR